MHDPYIMSDRCGRRRRWERVKMLRDIYIGTYIIRQTLVLPTLQCFCHRTEIIIAMTTTKRMTYNSRGQLRDKLNTLGLIFRFFCKQPNVWYKSKQKFGTKYVVLMRGPRDLQHIMEDPNESPNSLL